MKRSYSFSHYECKESDALTSVLIVYMVGNHVNM